MDTGEQEWIASNFEAYLHRYLLKRFKSIFDDRFVGKQLSEVKGNVCVY